MLFTNLRRIREDIEQAFNIRFDSGETALFARALEFIYARLYEIRFAELKARRLFPSDTSVPSGADTYTYRMVTAVGMAKLISNYADDLPRVDLLGKEFTGHCKSMGAAYGFSLQDIRRWAMTGQPLDQYKARAVRRAHEQLFDSIGAFGDSAANLLGITNHASVPLVTPDHAPWDLATPLEIIDDLNKLARAPKVNTKGQFPATNLLLDETSFELIAGKPMSSTGDSDKTVLRHFLDNNPYVKAVDYWDQLNDAGAAGVTRAMAYSMNDEVCALVESQPFEQLPPQYKNLETIINTHSRVGGAIVRQPLGIAYMDGTGE